jgi:hypothetical protein
MIAAIMAVQPHDQRVYADLAGRVLAGRAIVSASRE